MVLTALISAAIRRDSVFFLGLLFLGTSTFSCMRLHLIVFIFVLLMLVLSEVFLIAVISSHSRFLCSLLLVVSLYRRYLEYCCVLTLLLFLIHTICLLLLWDLRPFASSWLFLFSSPFVESLLSSTLIIVPSIFRLYLLIWWDSWNVVWFRVVSFSPEVSLFYSFLSSPPVCCPLPIFSSILKFPFFSEHSRYFLIRFFYSFSHLSFSAFHDNMTHFSMQNSIPIYSLYIITPCIRISYSF